MAKYFDEFLNEEIEVQDEITPEIGRELKLVDPDEFKELEGGDAVNGCYK